MIEHPLSADLNHIIQHTRPLWDALEGQSLFITGGTGFFGCWLLESFLWACDILSIHSNAVVLSRNPAAFLEKAPHLARHPRVELLQGDVRQVEFPARRFAYVIHAATDADAGRNQADPLGMLDTIVQGTRRVLEFAHVSEARGVLLTSSGAVYGKLTSDWGPVSEEYTGSLDPLDPTLAHGHGKRMAEQLAALYHDLHGLPVKLARCFAFVGPYLPLDRHFAIGNFIRAGLAGGPIVIKGDGTPIRSYLYAADLVIWLWKILFDAPPQRPFNVGSREAISIEALAHAVAGAFYPPPKVIRLQTPDRGLTPECYVPRVDRARDELGLTQAIDLQEGIARTIRWHRERRQA